MSSVAIGSATPGRNIAEGIARLFNGRRFVCHTGIQCIPIRDTSQS